MGQANGPARERNLAVCSPRRPFKCQLCVTDPVRTVQSGGSINCTPVDDNARAEHKSEKQQISGLEVKDYRRECVVKMPVTFSRVVSASWLQIPKPEVAREWEHMKSIADSLTPYNPEPEISILIGNNCPKAIRPREIVADGDEEPYALRTALGWGLIGRVCKSSDREDREEGVCNRVEVSEN